MSSFLPLNLGAGVLGFSLSSCLALAAALFVVGAWGVMSRRNVLLMLLSVEIMLNGVMLAFVAFARAQVNLTDRASGTGEIGHVFALFIIAIAAAEVAVGLAIVIAFFRNRASVDSRDLQTMHS